MMRYHVRRKWFISKWRIICYISVFYRSILSVTDIFFILFIRHTHTYIYIYIYIYMLDFFSHLKPSLGIEVKNRNSARTVAIWQDFLWSRKYQKTQGWRETRTRLRSYPAINGDVIRMILESFALFFGLERSLRTKTLTVANYQFKLRIRRRWMFNFTVLFYCGSQA